MTIALSRLANPGSSMRTAQKPPTPAGLAVMPDPGGNLTLLGVGCSDTYFAIQSARQEDLGSRAWVNPFTGAFQSTARDHTGHLHSDTSHMMLMGSSDLNPATNPGATFYAEVQYVVPDEYMPLVSGPPW